MPVPKGTRVGGRQKGVRNKTTLLREKHVAEAIEHIKDGGDQPLTYLLKVMRGEVAPDKDKLQAAVAAAPYIHPRLAAIEHSGNEQKPVHIVTGVPHSKEEADILMRMNGHARTQ